MQNAALQTDGASLATQSGAGQLPMSLGQRRGAFALLVAAYFITIVDFTIVNVALPTIGRKLSLVANLVSSSVEKKICSPGRPLTRCKGVSTWFAGSA